MPFLFKIRSSTQIKLALSLVWKATPGWTLSVLVMLALQSVLPLLQLYLMKLTVDAVTAGIASSEKAAALNRAMFLVCLTGASALVAVLLASIAKVAEQAQAALVTDHVQDILHAKSVALDLEYYEDPKFHDSLHRAQQEAPYRPTRIVNGLAQVAQNSASVAGIAALLFSFHWGIASVLLAAMVPGVLVRLKFADRMYAWKQKRSANERRADYLNWMLTGEIHAKEIRVFDLGPIFIQKFRELRLELRKERMAIAYRNAFGELGAQTGATVAMFFSFAFIAYRTVQGMMTLGDMVMYYQAFQRGQGFLKEALNGLADLYENNLFLTHFYKFLNMKPSVTEPHTPMPVPRPMSKGIEFDRVSFQYPTGNELALADVSLTIRPGQVVALVGENGSGKTTLVKLLCRLYDPKSGNIKIDNIDLRNIETTALRREISIIFQDYVHYQMTARENIWMGNVRLQPDDEKIITAAKCSGAHDTLESLPRGYETMLGRWFSDGSELSIGQWQKVALARAFLRDAQIIVLDEPTSSLDAKAEYRVFQNFRRLAAGRTAILISHRFSSIRMADWIFVLKDGRIVEQGTHAELIHGAGIYADLFETQARCYK
jgi:ATP-binding cassette, subfamily B, bacterial